MFSPLHRPVPQRDTSEHEAEYRVWLCCSHAGQQHFNISSIYFVSLVLGLQLSPLVLCQLLQNTRTCGLRPIKGSQGTQLEACNTYCKAIYMQQLGGFIKDNSHNSRGACASLVRAVESITMLTRRVGGGGGVNNSKTRILFHFLDA